MKSYTAEFSSTLNAAAAYLPTCWKITRQDGVVIGLTEFDRPLIIAGVTYQAVGGLNPSDVDRSLETNANQITLQSYFSASITEADIVRGAFNNAQVFVFKVDPFNLPTDLAAIPYQYEPLVSGRLGRFTLTDMGYSVEARGLQDALSTTQGQVTSKTCRNQFCDSICGLNIASFTETATVAGVTSGNNFTVNVSRSENYFLGGILTWLTGDNAGQTAQVIYSLGTIIRTLNNPANPVTIGDTATIQRGCDKSYRTCREIYGNGVNFQGEPGLPGQDELSKRADS
jgi:uncharacterized phage protein (TIGR02218 family)